MQKSKIEWTDYTLNPIKGRCPVDCKDNQGKSYCYARRMYDRFGWDEEIIWCPKVFRELDKLKAGSRVFIGSTMELFGPWVKDIWMNLTFEEVRLHPDLTFIFLTKRPENLIKWSPFPPNCRVGVSCIDYRVFSVACDYLRNIKATVKFISFEPLLDMEYSAPNLQYWFVEAGINWVIIGQQTPVNIKTMPKIEWISEIVEACDKVEIPVFLKDNLESLFGYPLPEWAEDKKLVTRVRQEFPNV